MTLLRSKREFFFVDQPTARHHTPRTPTRKANPKANRTKPPSRQPSDRLVLAARTRAQNVRYLQQAHEYQLATGDSANDMREKRRWLQAEFENSRISGKAARELSDYYNKSNITKPQNKRVKLDALTDEAKEIQRQVEEVFSQRRDPAPDAVGESSGAASINTVEDTLDSTATNEQPNADATDPVREFDTQPEESQNESEDESEDESAEDTDPEETEDEISSEENSSSEGGSSTPAAPPNAYGVNTTLDAAAIQAVRLLGLPLSEYYGGPAAAAGNVEGAESSSTGAGRGGGSNNAAQTEEDAGVFVKSEPDAEDVPVKLEPDVDE